MDRRHSEGSISLPCSWKKTSSQTTLQPLMLIPTVQPTVRCGSHLGETAAKVAVLGSKDGDGRLLCPYAQKHCMIAKMLIPQLKKEREAKSPNNVQRSHVTTCGEVIHRLHMAQPGDELHHLGWHLVLFILHPRWTRKTQRFECKIFKDRTNPSKTDGGNTEKICQK